MKRTLGIACLTQAICHITRVRNGYLAQKSQGYVKQVASHEAPANRTTQQGGRLAQGFEQRVGKLGRNEEPHERT